MNFDRRDIKPFLIRWFPSMDKATSEEWHFFLDRVVGIETPLDMPNAQAFDRWREGLSKLGYPVYPYHAADIAAIKAKADAALETEKQRAAALGKTLVDLANEAPNWPVTDMLKAAK